MNRKNFRAKHKYCDTNPGLIFSFFMSKPMKKLRNLRNSESGLQQNRHSSRTVVTHFARVPWQRPINHNMELYQVGQQERLKIWGEGPGDLKKKILQYRMCVAFQLPAESIWLRCCHLYFNCVMTSCYATRSALRVQKFLYKLRLAGYQSSVIHLKQRGQHLEAKLAQVRNSHLISLTKSV